MSYLQHTNFQPQYFITPVAMIRNENTDISTLGKDGEPAGYAAQIKSWLEVIMFGNMRGWLLYRVDAGDTLSGIVREVRPFVRTSVAQIVAANPRIEDPDVIQVGWRLRIPLR